MNTESESADEQGIERLGESQTATELILGSVAAALLAAAAWTATGETLALGWLLAVELVYAARYLAARREHKASAESAEVDRGLAAGLFVSGLMWGFAAAASLATYGATWLTGVVVAIGAALAIHVFGCHYGRRALVLPFTAAAAIPVGLLGFYLFEPATIVLGLSSLSFVVVSAIAARKIDGLADSFYAMRSARDSFRDQMRNAQQEIKRLEVGVKTNTEKQNHLERELKEASSDLLISEGKADALSSALERVTPYDNATGLLNAKKYVNVIEREWARMLRQELPITVVHAKIDNFDNYKEAYGNIGYEATIRRIAELMRKTGTRPGDVVARLDENKFALLLPEADHKNGETLAEVLRKQIRLLNIVNKESPMHSSVTASFGVATVIPNSDLNIQEFSGRADAALYEAQFRGGDKVVRFRTMNNIKLEKWDRALEGELTADGLIRKLAVLGYNTVAKTYRPGEYQTDKRVQIDTIDAIVQGQLKISLEGEARVLHPGDCLYIPKGHVTSVEVVGEKPVICLEGTRM